MANLALAAASRRIRDLEEGTGDALFERHARGMVPTAAGRVFVSHGVALLQSMDQLGTELADLRQGIARHVPLTASSPANSQFLRLYWLTFREPDEVAGTLRLAAATRS
ncbi:LysR family transcriptional regulator [Variovorax sp. PBL-E5]|uniref:LysR family transcriptional regulator n=1 Tax=Variovorax sp. PBL-E5 TaxID=434014 RepID=UPI0013A570DB|nr:LysR family transcriptional regulator [Variovorax sp. PBL-E5]